jgi:glycosyltransferase involved in cell wall biosynthesis
MIVGAYLRQAAPEHPAGAEWTIYDTFTWLTARGHDCRTLSEQGYLRERTPAGLVYSRPTDEEVAQHFQQCDVMLTQLDATMQAQLLARAYQTPLIQYVHSENQIDSLGIMESCSALVVFNAKHVADACSWWGGDSLVLHPAIDASRVIVERPGACTTLVNLSASKGGMILWRLAHSMETTPFLGVMGAYDDQVIQPDGLTLGPFEVTSTGLPANLSVLGTLRDIRGALAFTRTLLVLSHSETYGRIAGEAAVSGIPTITVDTPGLRECIGDAGIYVKRDDQRALERAIRMSYQGAWQWCSDVSRAQSEKTARRQERELRAFERALARIHAEQPEMTL